jgi:hypothetical protein
LNLPLDAKRAQHETAKYLPLPLYILYVQSTAYHEACDRHLDIQIHGDLDAAKAVLEEKPIIRNSKYKIPHLLYMYKDVKLEVLRRILLASVFESR